MEEVHRARQELRAVANVYSLDWLLSPSLGSRKTQPGLPLTPTSSPTHGAINPALEPPVSLIQGSSSWYLSAPTNMLSQMFSQAHCL